MDLNDVIENKRKIINCLNINCLNNYKIIFGNVLNNNDFEKICQQLNPKEPVAIINEGLMRYMTLKEKKILAINIYDVFKKFGGVWITCDLTPQSFINKQKQIMPELNKDIIKITDRNNINDRFENIEDAKIFCNDIGLDITEIYKFSEVMSELYSTNKLNINYTGMEEILENAIVTVIKIKK